MPRFQSGAARQRLLASSQLRQQLSKDTNVGEALRDTQGAIDQVPVMLLRTVTGLYSEPFSLGALPARPVCVEVVSVIDQASQEQAALCGSLCHFVWKPQNGGASVTSIDGLSANPRKTYRFTFRITFAPGAGV